jgi:very-short-patch-repair endonuclease
VDELTTLDDHMRLMRRTDKVGITAWPQQQILEYRVDFLVVARLTEGGPLHQIVVECDGHDFHERTKEQAARDRRRDRDLTAAGYKVFRFTGSEIFRNPKACVSEIRDFLRKTLDDEWLAPEG